MIQDLKAFICCFFLLGILFGCRHPSTAPEGSGNTTGKILTIGVASIPSEDPLELNDLSASLVGSLTQRTLYRLEKEKVVPDLAGDFPRVEAAGLRQRISLRPGAKFADGSAINAEVVVAALRRKFQKGARGTHALNWEAWIRDVRADGELTVILELKRPNAFLPALLTDPSAGIIKVNGGHILSAGAFALTGRTADEAILEPQGEGRGPTRVRLLRVRGEGNSTSKLDLDLAELSPNSKHPAQEGMKAVAIDSRSLSMLYFNPREPRNDALTVRDILRAAMQTPKAIEQIFPIPAEVNYGITPFAQGDETSRAQITERGADNLTQPRKIDFYLNLDPAGERVGENISHRLEKFKVQLRLHDFAREPKATQKELWGEIVRSPYPWPVDYFQACLPHVQSKHAVELRGQFDALMKATYPEAEKQSAAFDLRLLQKSNCIPLARLPAYVQLSLAQKYAGEDASSLRELVEKL